MRTKLYILFLLVLFVEAKSQIKPPVSYVPVREADVMWAKTMWRVIDIRDRFNFPFYFPLQRKPSQSNLFQVITDGIKNGKIKAFESDELVASDSISIKQVFDRISYQDSVTVYEADEFGAEVTHKKWVADTLAGEYIIQYWIKEQWFFDKQRSVMDVRIQAICPVKIDIEKEILVPLFWIDYEQARPWLNNYTAINSKNQAEQRTFDELFVKRKFESTIKKESNIYDREIFEYVETDKQALQESERIKEFLRGFESDLWEY